MCIVSNVSDWGQRKWPAPDPWVPTTVPSGIPGGMYPPVTPPLYTGPTRREWEDFKELVQKALDIDKALGTPDCVDPKKAEWMKMMEELYDAKQSST